jgi:hypothetical protein
VADIPEIELKMEIDYDPKQIYKDTSGNLVKVKFTIKAYKDDEPYNAYDDKVELSVLYNNGEIKTESIILEDFEARIIADEVKEYSPSDVEKARLALRGF